MVVLYPCHIRTRCRKPRWFILRACKYNRAHDKTIGSSPISRVHIFHWKHWMFFMLILIIRLQIYGKGCIWPNIFLIIFVSYMKIRKKISDTSIMFVASNYRKSALLLLTEAQILHDENISADDLFYLLRQHKYNEATNEKLWLLAKSNPFIRNCKCNIQMPTE